MANTNVEIQNVSFDISDPQITKVRIEIKHDDPGILLRNIYEKTFPARTPIVDLVKLIFGGEDDYLLW